MEADKFGAFMLTICIIAFIGGCTYTFTNDSDRTAMKECLSHDGYEWLSGDCVKQGFKG